jgi:hypothetical protein
VRTGFAGAGVEVVGLVSTSLRSLTARDPANEIVIAFVLNVLLATGAFREKRDSGLRTAVGLIPAFARITTRAQGKTAVSQYVPR